MIRSLLLCLTAAGVFLSLAVAAAFADTPAPRENASAQDGFVSSGSAGAAASDGSPAMVAVSASELPARAGEQESAKSQASAPGWSWRRASTAEYVGAAVTVGETLYLEAAQGDPKARWAARNDFDEGIRDGLRLKSRSARDAVNSAGTYLMSLLIAAPVLDSFATLGWRDSRWDAMWQTEVINLESYTFTGVTSSLLQNLIIPRERPFVRNCQGGKCEDSPLNRSMPSGHTAFAFTGAGLLCTHHDYQSLYGDAGADTAVCAAGLTLATVDGVLRIMSDRHYATDVLAGTAIGLFSGFLLPRWLHYYWPQPVSEADEGRGALVKRISLAPSISDDGAALTCSVTF